MSGSSPSNSPLSSLNYQLHKRLVFLYAALRTRSLMARDELARIAKTNPHAKLDLAWLISNQAITETDFHDALQRYREHLKERSPQSLSHMHRVNLAVLAIKLGEQQLAEACVKGLPNLYAAVKHALPKRLDSVLMQSIQEAMHATLALSKDYSVASRFLQLDVANPLRGSSHRVAQQLTQEPRVAQWFANLNRELFSKSIEPLSFAKPKHQWQTPFDLLTANVQPGSVSGPKVTVVMSAYHPDESIFTAVHSTLNQSYQNLELLVIDDCSPKEFDATFDSVAKLDPRIKVLRQSENGGTYRIRNRALDEATGVYITFQDSDDYMHPRRIELQVADLEKHANRMANISLSTRLTNRLEAIESNRRLRIGMCEPALMFRRVEVRDRIGYFDNVRKAGDSEFRKRLMKAYGQDCAVIHPFKILTVQRADNGGLTQGELGYRWITEFRLVYRDSYLYWHRVVGKASDWHISREEERHFYAPRQSRLPAAIAREPRAFDLVLGANLRDQKQIETVVARITRANQIGETVGLLQLNSLYPLKQPATISGKVMQLLNENQAKMVFASDAITAKRFELLAPSAFATTYSGEVFHWQVGQAQIEAAPESFSAEGVQFKLPFGN